jgi:hypothetical protein
MSWLYVDMRVTLKKVGFLSRFRKRLQVKIAPIRAVLIKTAQIWVVLEMAPHGGISVKTSPIRVVFIKTSQIWAVLIKRLRLEPFSQKRLHLEPF